MGTTAFVFADLNFVLRELTLFAATGFLVLGISDILVDVTWICLRIRRKFSRRPRQRFKAAADPGLLAIFIPAWDEADVIGDMLCHALSTLSGADYRIYVGCYPNDPVTVAAIPAHADLRIHTVIGLAPGPTTKADCLNRLWERMLDDEACEGFRAKAVVLHDAEDVVHSAELAVFDSLIERYDLVQLPVLPLIDSGSRWIAGSYADEFAEAHGKEMVVREALGASLPSAGVGCAFSRDALARIAAASGGAPFDAASLTEDYELGLKLHAAGGRAVFARLPGTSGLVATREHFPATLDAAVAQKARWMAGIALAGWDRLGWAGGLAERWMRLRDRQSVLAALVLCAGYLALLLGGAIAAGDILLGIPPEPFTGVIPTLLSVNAGFLFWRLAMRFGFVASAYGWREGLRAIPRVVVSNWIAMFAARQAVLRYLRNRRTGHAAWGKTAHAFPAILPAE